MVSYDYGDIPLDTDRRVWHSVRPFGYGRFFDN
jgi:hypothetical protein